ncbi:hypothetical protein [Streptomyces triculaminicus]|uniref:hypothetical protein n=1 Tax=Streptomyces triculaminicus TaxID=2816232 RepID=UPI0037BB25EA
MAPKILDTETFEILRRYQGFGDQAVADAKHEGLFYLTVRPGDARLTRVAAKIRTWNEAPGSGAGGVPDVTEPSQRRKAARYR